MAILFIVKAKHPFPPFSKNLTVVDLCFFLVSISHMKIDMDLCVPFPCFGYQLKHLLLLYMFTICTDYHLLRITVWLLMSFLFSHLLRLTMRDATYYCFFFFWYHAVIVRRSLHTMHPSTTRRDTFPL